MKVAICFLSIVFFIPVTAAMADVTITVDSIEDLFEEDGACTIREAIEATNLNADANECLHDGSLGNDTILFDGISYPAVIALNGTELLISDSLSIIGPGATQLTISGNNTSRIITVDSGVTVELSGLTLLDGQTPSSDGNAIDNDGVLTVTNCIFSNNFAEASGFGGAIMNTNTLTLRNTVLSNNGAEDAGAIFNSGTLNAFDCTIAGNVALDNGGITNTGTLNLERCVFLQNLGEIGAAIKNSGTSNISNSTFSRNGLVFGQGAAGIYNSGTLIVTNSTFSENESDDSEGVGAIFNEDGSGTTTLVNTIIANSSFVGNCAGTIIDGGNNLQFGGTIEESCGSTIPTPDDDPLGGNQPSGNGGPTETIALPEDSSAIDGGNDVVCAAAPVDGIDQRGVLRPQGDHCDIGSYESGILFLETFEINLANNWKRTKPIWGVTNEGLCGSTEKKGDILSPFGGCSQCTVEADMMIAQEGTTATLLAWFVDKRTNVEIRLRLDKDVVIFRQKHRGKTVAKGKKNSAGLNLNTVHRISVKYDGAAFQVMLDETLIIEAATSDPPQGTIGGRVKNGSACYSEFLVF